jgi:hypothetical protein
MDDDDGLLFYFIFNINFFFACIPFLMVAVILCVWRVGFPVRQPTPTAHNNNIIILLYSNKSAIVGLTRLILIHAFKEEENLPVVCLFVNSHRF